MISIGAAAKQTGIHVDTLRKWEARYGFPVPLRTAGGQRAFQDSDLALLHQVARNIASGQRAGAAIRITLESCSGVSPSEKRDHSSGNVKNAIGLLQSHALESYEAYVEDELVRLGLTRFCFEFALPLVTAVGDSWQSGALPVYAEHAFSQHLQALVSRQLPDWRSRRGAAPCFLLALPAGDNHSLALTLLNALLLDAGFTTVLFQSGLPAAEIAAAAAAYHVDVVAVSCSLASGKRLLQDELTELRRAIPRATTVWVGGAGAMRLPTRLPGVEYISSMADALERANALRAARSTGVGLKEKGNS